MTGEYTYLYWIVLIILIIYLIGRFIIPAITLNKKNAKSLKKINQQLEEQYKEGLVYDIKGARGRRILIYDNKCIIKVVPTIGSIITKNATDGEKVIYYRDCIGIQSKYCRATLGCFQLETASGLSNNKFSNFFNENTFTFEADKNEMMFEVISFVKKKVEELKSNNN